MMKDHPSRSKHPLVAYPFEAFLHGSWQAVKHVKIEDGAIIAQVENDGIESQEVVTMNKLRIRSRKASASDCRFFLRPNIDVCAYSIYPNSSGNEFLPGWHDAKVVSIERKSHSSRCMCQFSVSFYRCEDEINKKKRKLDGHAENITIDDIVILQKLTQKSSEDGYERWNFSTDCDVVDKSKLTKGIFMSEISWLLVLSILRRMVFSIKLIRNKVEYIIVDDADVQHLFNVDHSNNKDNKCENQDIFPVGRHHIINIINFRRCNGTMLSMIENLTHMVTDDTSEVVTTDNLLEVDDDMINFTDLRCSTRRRLLPDRYVDCSNLRKVKRFSIGLTKEKKEDTSSLKINRKIYKQICDKKENSKGDETDPFDDFLCEEKLGSRKKKLQQRHENFVFENGNMRRHSLESKDASFLLEDGEIFKQVDGQKGRGQKEAQIIESSCKEKYGITKKLKQRHLDGSVHKNPLTEKQEKASLFFLRTKQFLRSTRKLEFRKYKQKNFGVNDWKEEIEICMRNIRGEMEKQDPNVVSQWETNKTTNISKQCWKFNWAEDTDAGVQSLEHEDLWKEMDISMAALHSHNVHQEPGVKSSDMHEEGSCEDDSNPCKHDCRFDEEVGYICQLCNVVIVQIRDVLPPFLQTSCWIRRTDDPNGDVGQDKYYETYKANTDIFFGDSSMKDRMPEQYDSVWFLIPEFRAKLHDHQRKAFEFLWKNIAGSLKPKDMECMIETCGGCVVTHAPGTGKTLLVISFLISYLKLFPRKRPLVLAPKSTLHAWYKEFEKWHISLPIHQIHAINHHYRKRRQRHIINETIRNVRIRRGMMHLRDCFDKLQKWHEQPSILLMSYSSFFHMTREDAPFKHQQYIAKVLRQSPGILVLDEGHNPRSTRSKLRKVLMEVETELRILLSGTLFQNNFEEYFNTLCLARPTFISEMAREFELTLPFDGNSGGINGKKSISTRREMLARRSFVEIIGRSINSSSKEEMRWGLNLLQKMTKGFVDYYDGGMLDRLPGLQLYTLLMKSTNVQERLLSKLDVVRTYRSSLELELLITAGSIHPWLMKEFACSDKFLSINELQEIDTYRHDIKEGPKVMFVVDLMRHCIVNGEKMLIFCRNIPPLNFFVDLFKSLFGWQKNREVLVLQGELDSYERSQVMDKFQESGSTAHVLLASTTASAEGINLTAASRVVLLDPEWNPSKTKQAIARAFRLGQERVVYVYRLLMSGTLEDEKYKTNQLKDRLARMIFVGEWEEDSNREMDDFDDSILRELVKGSWKDSFEMIIKREKGGNRVWRGCRVLH